MFDLNILNLGAKLHYLRVFWGTLTKQGDRLRQMYEAFLMDVGLDGNIFDKNYNVLGYLAEHSWFEHTWQLCHMFQCKLTLQFPENPEQGREGDKAILQVFLDSGLFSKKKIKILQRVRRFKKVHFLSDALCADGRTVRPDMLTGSEVYSRRDFSRERPTKPDLELWCHALRSITSM